MSRIETQAAPPAVGDLLEERARLQQWLSRLEQNAAAASPRVVDRVRADYDTRLAAVLTALAGHLDALRQESATLAAATDEAESQYRRAEEELEELRLRHLIGEIDSEEWERAEPEMQEGLSDAGRRRDDAAAAARRITELVAQIEGGLTTVDGEARGGGPAPAPAVPEPEETARPLAPLPSLAVDVPAGQEEEEEDFLAELDRAIAASGSAALQQPGAEEDEGADARPDPGTKCPECGYTNDADAWYCGVCGVDLG